MKPEKNLQFIPNNLNLAPKCAELAEDNMARYGTTIGVRNKNNWTGIDSAKKDF